MRKTLLILFLSLGLINKSSANHITGGEMYYTFLGQSGGVYDYQVTLKLFRDPNSGGAPLDAAASIAVFNLLNNSMVWSNSIPLTSSTTLTLVSPSPCILNPPLVQYQVGYYTFNLSLPGSAAGYIISYQRCCRINGINNLLGSAGIGATYTAHIPGTSNLATAPENNSAQFLALDTVIVCANNPISYSFAATDADGDILSYSFCNAFPGGSSGAPAPSPPGPPPYFSVAYAPPFSGTSPMGIGVTIDPATGQISGMTPAFGIYVVTVCVTETRNGVVIAVQRKEVQIKVSDCTTAQALLNPRPVTCDGFNVFFQNDAPPSPLINSYFWDFGVTTLTNDTSNLATPTFIYPDTGVYIVKLVTNRNQQCSDSTTTIVRVYPGFFPGFISSGTCINFPIQFQDTTSTIYGVVDTWSWNFGDQTTLADTSHNQNPSWLFATPGVKNVSFIVTNSKGCVDTVYGTVDVLDKPPLGVSPRDTLICRNDAVQLQATGTGVFSWTPPLNIVGANTATPTVNPPVTRWYYVMLNENGCINRDSVQVRVIANVTVNVNQDTTICLGDPAFLGANTDGLSYLWSPTATLNDPTLLNPTATPLSTTTYVLRSTVGSCSNLDSMTVFVVPYPIANAGADQIICFNKSAQLNASMVGSSFTWTPTSYLDNPNVLNPVSSPPRTTDYILTVFDTQGCPKPGRDTVTVTMLPRIRPFAGRDTTVIVGQPLQFNATGGVSYVWSPATGLSNTNIPNPVGTYGPEIDSVRYKVIVSDIVGCSDSAFILVRVFKTNPYVFVPTAFTPNNDGLNDVIRPIAVGVQKINYFTIYNRWGQMVFTTTINGAGWDGRIAGTLQPTNVFVWMVSAIDYTGKPIFLKGHTTLIR